MKRLITNLGKTMFGRPSIHKAVVADLDTAQRELLDHQAKAEYHQHMASYYATIINRLTVYGTALKEIPHDDPLQSAPAALHDQQVGRRDT